jgi:diguanylate cyclase (GGDEF)-like protein
MRWSSARLKAKRKPASAASPMDTWKGNLVLDACAGIDEETIRRRTAHVSVLFDLAVMSGLQMNLAATLSLLADHASRIVAFDSALIYYWKESEERSLLRHSRGVDAAQRDALVDGNLFDFWMRQHGRAMMIAGAEDERASAVLESLSATSALVVPLMSNNRSMGSLQLFSRRGDAFSLEDAQLVWMLARIAQNLLTREYASEGLIHFAFTDHLTGLKTRGFFEQQLELEIKRCERKAEKLTLLMLDIDHFKCLNDTFGHPVGDRVLRQVACVLTEDMREIDTVARYGGEEFVIILPETSSDEGQAVAQRIRAAVEKTAFLTRENNLPEPLSISIGMAVYGEDTRSKRDLLHFADAALYFAKGQGRNRVVRYAEMPDQQRKEVS